MKKQDKQSKDVQNVSRRMTGKNMGVRVAFCGCILGFALLLGYVEFLIPFSFGIPGVKLGLANLAVVLCLYQFGWKEALAVCVGRILISSFLFGNSFALLYSLAGGLLSFVVMCMIKRMKNIGIGIVSMSGGIFHNIAQLFVAYFVVKQGVIFYYVPFLVFFGALTGVLNGMLAKLIGERISKTKIMGE